MEREVSDHAQVRCGSVNERRTRPTRCGHIHCSDALRRNTYRRETDGTIRVHQLSLTGTKTQQATFPKIQRRTVATGDSSWLLTRGSRHDSTLGLLHRVAAMAAQAPLRLRQMQQAPKHSSAAAPPTAMRATAHSSSTGPSSRAPTLGAPPPPPRALQAPGDDCFVTALDSKWVGFVCCLGAHTASLAVLHLPNLST